MENGVNIRYVSVRMAENSILRYHLLCMNPEIYTCIWVKSHYISEYEAKMLNEINIQHCQQIYGKSLFEAGKDYIVHMEDVRELYTFLEFCCEIIRCSVRNSKCGFVKINKSTILPYCKIKGNRRYVPIDFFEGQTESLQRRTVKLENWNLAYLKFACIAMGINKETLFNDSSCDVICLSSMKRQFPRRSRFIEFWPSKLDHLQPLTEMLDELGPKEFVSSMWIKLPIVTMPTIEMVCCWIILFEKILKIQAYQFKKNPVCYSNKLSIFIKK